MADHPIGCECSCGRPRCGRPTSGISSYCSYCIGGQCGDWLDDPESEPADDPSPPTCFECGDWLEAPFSVLCPGCRSRLEQELAEFGPIEVGIDLSQPREVLDALWERLDEKRGVIGRLFRSADTKPVDAAALSVTRELLDRERVANHDISGLDAFQLRNLLAHFQGLHLRWASRPKDAGMVLERIEQLQARLTLLKKAEEDEKARRHLARCSSCDKNDYSF
jgi:hypothetical protein